MKIRKMTLLLAAGMVAAMLLMIGSILMMKNAARMLEGSSEASFHSYLLADELRQSSDDLTRLVRTYVVTGDARYKDQYMAVLDIRNGKKPRPEAYHRIYWDFVAGGVAKPRPDGETITLKELMTKAGFTAQEFALLDEAAANSDGLVNFEVEAMELAESGDESKRAKAVEMVHSKQYHEFKAGIMKPVDEFFRVLEERTLGQMRADERVVATWQWVSIILALFLLVAMGLFIRQVMSKVLGGMKVVGDEMTRVSEGELDEPTRGMDRTDEVGDMARRLETFRTAALDKVRMEEDAKAERERAEAERAAFQEKTAAEAKAAQHAATSAIARGLRALAAADMTARVTESVDPDFEELRADFNEAVEKLETALRKVGDAAEAIAGGSDEISGGSQDLSNRTEAQAATVEETAAALEQMTSSVKEASTRASEAQQLVERSRRGAEESGEIVRRAVGAMDEIEKSSTQISNITGAIEDIAFQTNLLALNAGIEAARAGEAGKGFAVVAQEIRHLAQRSADAAKEIADLIKTSVENIGNGVGLVKETGDSLEKIIADVQEIAQHMSAIAEGAREQSTGLSEINTAVVNIDKNTQHNAALVEETTAATANLVHEADQLRGLLAEFTISGDMTAREAA